MTDRTLVLGTILTLLSLPGCDTGGGSPGESASTPAVWVPVSCDVVLRAELPVNTAGDLILVAENLSEDTVIFSRARLATDFSIHLWDRTGNELWPLLYLPPFPTGPQSAFAMPCPPGGKRTWTVSLSDIYPFAAGQRYLVMVRRFVHPPGQVLRLESNTVVFDVATDGSIRVIDADASHPSVSDEPLQQRAVREAILSYRTHIAADVTDSGNCSGGRQESTRWQNPESFQQCLDRLNEEFDRLAELADQ